MSLVRLSELIAEHRWSTGDDPTVRVNHYVWCPGCEAVHALNVVGPAPWGWDSNVDAPTYTPSLLANAGGANPRRPVCHSFIVAGQWQFLGDSTHALAGQTVPMVAYPEEYL